MAGPPMLSRVMARRIRTGGGGSGASGPCLAGKFAVLGYPTAPLMSGARPRPQASAMTSATLAAPARASASRVGVSPLSIALPLLAPSVLLLAGCLVGLLGTLNPRVAQERIIGVLLATLVSLLALGVLQRAQKFEWLAGASLLASVWVIAASGPDVFRGPVGSMLNAVFKPLYGLV